MWMQHPTLRYSNHEMFESLRRWLGITTFDGPLPLDLTIAAMDQGGLVRPEGSTHRQRRGGQLRRRPERLRAVAGADLRTPMEAVRELRRRVDEGFVALRIVPWLWGLPPTDRLYYPLYVACVDLGVPFCSQVGHTGSAAPIGDRPADPVHRPDRPRPPGADGRVRTHRLPVDDRDDRSGRQAPQRLHRHQRLLGQPLPSAPAVRAAGLLSEPAEGNQPRPSPMSSETAMGMDEGIRAALAQADELLVA